MGRMVFEHRETEGVFDCRPWLPAIVQENEATLVIILWKETTEIEPSLIEALPELEYTEILLQLFYHYCFGPLECYVHQ